MLRSFTFCRMAKLFLMLIAAGTAVPASLAQQPGAGLSLRAPGDLTIEQARTNYETALSAFRSSVAKAAPLRTEVAVAGAEEGELLREEWVKSIYETNKYRIDLERAAMQLFELDENIGVDVENLVVQVSLRASAKKKMGKAWHLAGLLRPRLIARVDDKNAQKNLDTVRLIRGVGAFYVCDLKEAGEYLDDYKQVLKDFPEDELILFNQFGYYQTAWPLEQERLEKNAADLPIVRLVTNLGDIEIELFEDAAPITVNNFINLVEKGFYNETTFDFVEAGMFARGGFMGTDNKPRMVNYLIPDEWESPAAHMHGYGYITMLKPSTQNSAANSVFGITLRPMANMDGVNTAFGRVIRGMEIVEEFEVTHEEKEKKTEQIVGAIPTVLIRAEVVRKRDHDYLPGNEMLEKLASEGNPSAGPGNH